MTTIIIIMVLYLAAMILIGLKGSKYSGSMKEFLTAGKQGGMIMLVGAYIGAHIGNGIVVGGAEYGANIGIAGLWYGLGACASYVLFALVMSKKVYREGYITIPDMINARYNSKAASVIVAILNICASLGITAAQLMAGASLFKYIGLDPTLGAVVTALIVFIYCTISGMWGVMVTDTIQSSIIYLGTIAVIIVMAVKGGFGAMATNLPAESFNMFPLGAEAMVMLFLPSALNGLISGASFQRTASCKNEKVAVLAPIFAAGLLVPFVVLPVLVGMYGKAIWPDADSSIIIFKVLNEAMPPVVAGLMVAAILSAVMSTVDIGLLNITANSVNDIYHKVINPNADQKKLARLSKIVTFAAGIIALYLTLSSSSILSLLSATYSFMNAGALVMVIGGIYWKKATKEGAVASALVGMLFVGLNRWGIVTLPYASVTPLIPAAIAFIIVSLATQKKEKVAA